MNDEIIEADEKDCNFAEDPKGAAKKGEEDEEGVEERSTTLLIIWFQLRRRGCRRRGGTRKGGFFLKEFLHRSKSEGRRSNHKFWSSISFSAAKEKKPMKQGSQTQKAQGSVSKDPNAATLRTWARKGKN
ncbi:hypothetical protein D8674_013007 [Pyrus ussuriensis x Pyrus communis]|uniref:Uncharacterized protein n=1 Tax=Pyrus ussuriensis x Pyrus communis TaxID=2448454 RepID=A0A5N5GPB8_9ROSA|nr:hypothetical protein D8674_013007 [Pyrus ussuriensis x Pyrus communis]